MIEVPKLVLIILLVFVAWQAKRWWNRQVPKSAPRPAGSARQPVIEDLVACRTCGAYVATSARHCGKPGCPQPR